MSLMNRPVIELRVNSSTGPFPLIISCLSFDEAERYYWALQKVIAEINWSHSVNIICVDVRAAFSQEPKVKQETGEFYVVVRGTCRLGIYRDW